MNVLTESFKGEKGDYLFFSTKDPIRAAYAYVSSFVFVFGFLMNSLLIYLIKTKTVAGMEIYKKLLYISCFMDLTVSFWNFIVQPIPCNSSGYRIMLMNGLFRKSSQPIRYAVYLIWVQFYLIFLLTTMSQYVYRFFILCRNGVFSAKIILPLIIGETCLFFTHAFLITWADYPREELFYKMNEIRIKIFEESGISDIEFISFVHARNYRWLMHLTAMLFLFPGFYLIVGICFFKIKKAIREMNVLKLKEHNKQVSAALLFQALLPSFEVIGWTIQVFGPVFITGHSIMYTVATDIPVTLISALNPIGTIFLVAPYRRAVFRYFGITKAQSTVIRIRTTIQTTVRRYGTASIHPIGRSGN